MGGGGGGGEEGGYHRGGRDRRGLSPALFDFLHQALLVAADDGRQIALHARFFFLRYGEGGRGGGRAAHVGLRKIEEGGGWREYPLLAKLSLLLLEELGGNASRACLSTQEELPQVCHELR